MSIGQQTGSDNDSHVAEARQILDIIVANYVSREKIVELCGENSAAFVNKTSARIKQYGPNTLISGKELFWLRDIKDKLIENGVL